MRLRGECEHGYFSEHSTSFRLGEGSWCEGSPVFDGVWVDWCETHNHQIDHLGARCALLRLQLVSLNSSSVTSAIVMFGECVKGRRIIAKETAIKGDDRG